MNTKSLMNSQRKKRGFTLVELMIASSVSTALVTGTVMIFFVLQQSWFTTAVAIDTVRDASSALERLVYGASGNPGLRATTSADAFLTYPAGGNWRLNTSPTDFVAYDAVAGSITNQDGYVFCENMSTSTATMGPNGCTIMVGVQGRGGRQNLTTTMRTQVQFRN